MAGKWLWLSRYNGRFQYQRSGVWLQSSAKIYIEHLFVYLLIIDCIEKTKINKKRPRMAHFIFKKTIPTW